MTVKVHLNSSIVVWVTIASRTVTSGFTSLTSTCSVFRGGCQLVHEIQRKMARGVIVGCFPSQGNSHACYDSGLGITFNATDYDARDAGSISADCRIIL